MSDQIADEGLNMEDQEDTIRKFQEVCAVDDEHLSRDYLERCGWELEFAVQEYLNVKDGRPSLLSQEGRENVANQEQELRRRRGSLEQAGTSSDEDVPPPQLRRGRRVQVVSRMTWGQWAWSIFTLPFHFTVNIFSGLLRFIWNMFFVFRAPMVTDPAADVRSFVQQFEAQYGDQHPEFFDGSYSAALDVAKRELRFMVVYLHSSDHQDTDFFCRTTLIHPDLAEFVRNQNIIFWAASVRSPEGYRVSLALREGTYPFVGLICLRDNRMTLVVRQEGMCDAAALIATLAIAIQDNQTFLALARNEREQHEMNQRLRGEQEQAFQESLQMDREREERRREELERQRKQQKEDAELQLQDQRRREWLGALRRRLGSELPPEPDSSAPDCVRVSLKFPSGTRLQRNFLLTDSLELLWNVCFLNEECPENFSLATNFPRRQLRCRPAYVAEYLGSAVLENDGIPTFQQAELNRSVMIFVQDDDA